MKASLNIVDRILTLEQDAHDLSTEEGMAAMAEFVSTADSTTTLTAQRFPVFAAGWNRNKVAPHVDHLQAVADSMENNPVLFSHDEYTLVGAGRNAVLELGDKPTVYQDLVLDVSSPVVAGWLKSGANLRASIGLARTEKTKVLCNLCDSEWLVGDCEHMPWEDRWQGQLTHVKHTETSITPRPACEGTGSDARFTADIVLGESYTSSIPDWMFRDMQVKLSDRKSRQAAELSESIASLGSELKGMKTLVSELTAERDTAVAEKARLAREDALRAVRQVRRDKALVTPQGMSPTEFEGRLADQYLGNPDGFSLWATSIPKSVMTDTISANVEAQYDYRADITAEPGTTEYYSQQAAAARKLAALKGVSYREALTTIKQES